MLFGKKPDAGFDPGYPQFPLNLRVGAILAPDEAEVLRFEGLALSWRPPQGEVLATALSSMELFGLRLVRAYARSGDQDLLFQFNLDASGALLDISLFGLLEEIRPATADDWGMWLDPGGLIGGADLNAPNGQHYLRQWGEGDYAAPVSVTEPIYTDPKAPPRLVEHRMALYAREVGEENENVLVSADTDSEQSLVRAWVGLDLSPVGVRIY
jgi:hypothetical protein